MNLMQHFLMMHQEHGKKTRYQMEMDVIPINARKDHARERDIINTKICVISAIVLQKARAGVYKDIWIIFG
jgi:hypothetical protein